MAPARYAAMAPLVAENVEGGPMVVPEASIERSDDAAVEVAPALLAGA